MPDPKHGAAGVVRELVAGAAAEHARSVEASRGEQIALFEPPTRFHGARRDAVRVAVARSAAAGRPAGSANLSNKQLREFLGKMGVNPLVQLARFALMPPHLLAQELGCTPLEAFREWRILQVELAPYLNARMLPVDDDGKVPPWFNMVIGGGNAGPGDAEIAPWLRAKDVSPAAPETQQNQAFSASPAPLSQNDLSHEADK